MTNPTTPNAREGKLTSPDSHVDPWADYSGFGPGGHYRVKIERIDYGDPALPTVWGVALYEREYTCPETGDRYDRYVWGSASYHDDPQGAGREGWRLIHAAAERGSEAAVAERAA